jgi:hypothetical protein
MKNASGVMIPAAGATLAFYRQGATAMDETVVPYTTDPNNPVVTDIPVYNVGSIVVGDQLQNGPINIEELLDVVAVSAKDWTLSVTNHTEFAEITVPAGGRLFRVTQRPKVYADPLGTVEIGTSLSADGDGWLECYARDFRFDGIVADVFPFVTFIDQEGSWVAR